MYTFYVCLYGLVSSDSFFVIITRFFFFNIHSLIWSTKTINKHIYFNMVNCVPLYPLPKNFPRYVCCAPFTYSFPWCLCPLFLFPPEMMMQKWCLCPKHLKCVPPFPFPFSSEMSPPIPYFPWNVYPLSLYSSFPCGWRSLTSGIMERFYRLQLNVTCLVPCPYVTTFSADQFSLWI